MDRLSKRDEYRRNTKLMGSEVFHDVSVESKDTEFVGTHNSGEKLHDKNFVVEGITFVVTVEHVVKLLTKGLRVVQ